MLERARTPTPRPGTWSAESKRYARVKVIETVNASIESGCGAAGSSPRCRNEQGARERDEDAVAEAVVAPVLARHQVKRRAVHHQVGDDQRVPGAGGREQRPFAQRAGQRVAPSDLEGEEDGRGAGQEDGPVSPVEPAEPRLDQVADPGVVPGQRQATSIRPAPATARRSSPRSPRRSRTSPRPAWRASSGQRLAATVAGRELMPERDLALAELPAEVGLAALDQRGEVHQAALDVSQDDPASSIAASRRRTSRKATPT